MVGFKVNKMNAPKLDRRENNYPVIYDRRKNRENSSTIEVAKDRRLHMLITVMGQMSDYLINPLITDIILNPDQMLWVEKIGEGRIKTDIKISESNAASIIKLIATQTDQGEISKTNPIISTEIPGCGYRFEGVMPPITETPSFCIRKSATTIFSLEDYLKKNILTKEEVKYIKNCVKNYKNIMIAGGTGSGKSTLANAILQEIATYQDRLIIIEDTRELKCDIENITYMKSNDHIDMTRLLKSAMRQDPDRIVVGEVRGSEALALLKAWNTGHPGGITTLHANNAINALTRLEQLILEGINTPQHKLIAESVDVVIYIKKINSKQRKVTEIIEINDYVENKYQVRIPLKKVKPLRRKEKK